MTDASQEFVTIWLDGQQLGIPVLLVHDVLKPQKITRVPLAADWVAGVLNLRGRIVTAIDLRARLGLPPREESAKGGMSVVVEYGGEPYSLLFDRVGEVVRLEPDAFEKTPVTLDPRWREVCDGIYRMPDGLMLALNVDRLLGWQELAAA